MSEPYAIRIPFQISRELSGLDSAVNFEDGGLRYRLYKVPRALVLLVQPFESYVSAWEYYRRFWSALATMSVSKSIGFLVRMDTLRQQHALLTMESETGSSADPMPHEDDGNFAIMPTVRPISGMDVTTAYVHTQLAVARTAERFISDLRETLDNLHSDALYCDDKTRLAFELFSSSLMDAPFTFRLLNCITALEILASGKAIHPSALRLLNGFESQLKTELGAKSQQDDESAALDSLLSRVHFLKEESLGSSIQRLIAETFPSMHNAELTQRQKDIKQAYRVRSGLVHRGKVEEQVLIEAFMATDETLRLILSARIADARRKGSA